MPPRKPAPTAADVMLGQLTEREFQNEVLQLAALFGWRPFHPHDSRRSHKGWPDLALLRGDRLVMAELKSMAGKVRPEQAEWLDELALVPGVESYLWRPSDLGAIAEVLR
jgi:hypothetical protein